MKFPTPFAEKSLTLVAAAFDRRGQAERAAAALRSSPGLAGTVRLVAPCEGSLGRKFEAEQDGIWRTALRSHLLLGVLGLALGLSVRPASRCLPGLGEQGRRIPDRADCEGCDRCGQH